MTKRCTVILTNWNGWKDTVECLESLIRQDYRDLDIIVVDNASSDDSIQRLRLWSANQGKPVKTKFPAILTDTFTISPKEFIELTAKEIVKFSVEDIKQKPTVYLIKNHINAGFAKGNNLAISFALTFLKTEYIFLLNNDTIAEHDAVSQLVHTIEKYPGFSVLQSAIYYYDDPHRVWNLGGKILPWAQIKYYREVKKQQFQPIDFISGCALFGKADLFQSIGLLNDNFFHGEEDFEFSLRLKRNQRKAAVVFPSIIYHKIGMSVSKQWTNGDHKILNFALNRIINMRNYFPNPIWQVWRLFTQIYFFYLMLTYYHLPIGYALKISRAIYVWSKRLKRVNRRVLNYILEQING